MTFDEKFPIATREKASPSLKFASMASADLESARLLHSNRLYPQSLYLLQQAVEKASKGFGILTGTFSPDSRKLAKEIGHRPLARLLSGASEILFEVTRRTLDIVEMRDTEVPDWIKKNQQRIIASENLTMWKLSGRFSSDKVRGLGNLPQDLMWRATLDLDERVPEIQIAVRELKDDPLDRRLVKVAMWEARMTPRMSPYEKAYIEYAYNVIGAAIRLYPLNMLTMWHVNSTRYPDQGHDGNLNWKPECYDSGRPLIKALPILFAKAQSLSDSVRKASQVALKAPAPTPRIMQYPIEKPKASPDADPADSERG